MLKRIHHINFVVHNLDDAVQRYENLFQIKVDAYEDHPQRPVKTARFRIGETWIVLVEPLDNESVPAKHLQEHGEGFFLISYEVENIDNAIKNVKENGGLMLDEKPRQGILNWQVADLNPDCSFNALTQLVEEKR